jgi:carboxymuconolactone decarboxylase family protein
LLGLSVASNGLRKSPPDHPLSSTAREEVLMSESMYPQATKALAEKRSELAPEIESAFRQFSQAVFRDGTLPSKTKQLIAVAVAHVTQCPLYVVGCPAGGHIRWTARKAVSLRCPFGDRTRAVDPAPLFHAPLFRYPGTRCGADPVYKVDRCGAVAV